MVGTPKNPPERHKTFGISDSLLDAVRKVQSPIAEDDTADFKKKHSTTVTPGPRKVGGMGDVAIDIKDMSADEFKRKYKMSKSEFQKQEGRMSDYQYNKESWLESLRKVGTDGLIKEESITVQMNPGGTTYKVLSVSKDIGGRIKVGENLTDTHIDDLRDMDISISYKGGKDGKTMKKMESVDVDAKNADKAIKHDCATHVVHKEHGEGQCIPGEHTLEETSELSLIHI